MPGHYVTSSKPPPIRSPQQTDPAGALLTDNNPQSLVLG